MKLAKQKYKNDISKIDNMTYDNKNDCYICKNEKRLTVNHTKTRKSKTGYKSEITCYTCENCNDCEFKSKCIKDNNSKTPLENRTKNLQISKLFNEKCKENSTRIISPEGTELRMNRSIQAEGAFTQVKGNMGFRRALCKGEKNVLAECILLGMAHNINKFHNKMKNGTYATYLHPLKKCS